MDEERKTTNWDAILRNVTGGAILLGLGYMLSVSNDRYRGSTATRDFTKVYEALDAMERRLIERMKDHALGGPHDDVQERLVRHDERLKVLERLREVDEVQ
jgi:mRNA-degrading endonuclease YafQ of YafQ-DinJ toxin-antitoxin module